MAFVFRSLRIATLVSVACFVCDYCAFSQQKDSTKAVALTWSPPRINASIRGLDTVTPCPLLDLLQRTGTQAAEMLQNLENFTALEQIDYLKLNANGAEKERENGLFDYVYALELQGNSRQSREYRSPVKAGYMFAASSQDTGEAALGLIFVPDLQGDYEMRCEGMDRWHDQLAWVVHFEQRSDKPARTFFISTPPSSYPARLRGRAWISVERNQVIHLETSFQQSLPSINLVSGTISVDYAPVQIQSKELELWLPLRIQAFWEHTDGRTIFLHRFSNFKVFSVDTEQHTLPPKQSQVH